MPTTCSGFWPGIIPNRAVITTRWCISEPASNGSTEVRYRLRDADAAELALWFHDAVYDPSRDDNELRSAFLFDRELGIHMPTQRADDVHAMIMATTHDGAAGLDDDACYVADIDLSGLAADRRW